MNQIFQDNLLEMVDIVLVNTSHPGNIGSAARAMKTMGLSKLVLAYPESPVDGQSYALAAGAGEILDNLLEPQEAGALIVASALEGRKVSLMFGCERTGLTNEELEVCHYHVTIPANPEYSSLNLAMAVQVLTYEIRQAYLKYLGMDPMKEEIVHTSEKYLDKEQPASGDEIIGFHQHLEEVLLLTGFLHENNRGSIMRKIKRIFSRPYLTRDDVNILRGILSSVTRTVGKTNE